MPPKKFVSPQLPRLQLRLGFHAPSNVKKHPTGIVTYTIKRDPYTGVPKEMLMRFRDIMEHGWGNGYIAIPEGHPVLKNMQRSTSVIILTNIHLCDNTYDWFADLYPLSHNCYTWSDYGNLPGFAGRFYIFGFDTAHAWQNSRNWPQKRVIATVEDIANRINIDYRTQVKNFQTIKRLFCFS